MNNCLKYGEPHYLDDKSTPLCVGCTPEGHLEIYHGSYKIIEKLKIRNEGTTRDFGFGFYCTNILKQA